jgi:hypothetical protein
MGGDRRSACKRDATTAKIEPVDVFVVSRGPFCEKELGFALYTATCLNLAIFPAGCN